MKTIEKIYNKAIEAALDAGKKILEVYNSDNFHVTEKKDNSPLTLADRTAHETILSYLKDTEYPVLSEEGRNIPFEERKKWTTFWLVDPLDGTKEFIKRNDEFTVNIALIENGSPIFGVVFAPVLKDLYVGLVGAGAWLLTGVAKLVDLETVRKSGKELKSEVGGRRSEVGSKKAEVGGPSSEVGNRKSGLDTKTSTQHPAPSTPYLIVASRSHLNSDTKKYIDKLKTQHASIKIVSKGSSLKLCMVAAGEADEYPRLGPTMEWDVAAAHAVVLGAGKSVKIFGTDKELIYNKEDLLNPYFLVI